jgi:hypothetical protein
VGEGEGCEKMKKYYGVLCVSEHQAEITSGHYGPDVTPKKLALGLSTEMPEFREGEKIVIDCPFCPTEIPKIYKATEIVFFDEGCERHHSANQQEDFSDAESTLGES